MALPHKLLVLTPTHVEGSCEDRLGPGGTCLLQGYYTLVPGKKVNDFHVWQRDTGYGGAWCLCSTTSGYWQFIPWQSDSEQSIDELAKQDKGWVFSSEEHDGALPHLMAGVWQWLSLDGRQFLNDATLKVIDAETHDAKPPLKLRVASPTWHKNLTGIYCLVLGREVHGFPVWKKQGPNDVWLYNDVCGYWVVHGSIQLEQIPGTMCVGELYSSACHRGVFPNQWKGGWQAYLAAEEESKDDENIEVVEFRGLNLETSRQLGIGYNFVTRIFPGEVQNKWQCLVELPQKASQTAEEQEFLANHSDPNAGLNDMTFFDLSKIAAYGKVAYGKGKLCPRDGKEDCSIVDAVYEEDHSRAATFYLSWVWAYTFAIALSALRNFRNSNASLTDDDCVFWWCFFPNNQFRILGDNTQQSFETLRDVFSRRLQDVGKMVCMLNRLHDSTYSQRLWCLYEVYIASVKKVPMEVMIPIEAVGELDDLVRGDGIRNVKSAIQIDSSKAKATFMDDQRNIKALIEALPEGYKTLNKKVKGSLKNAVVDLFRGALADSDSD